MKKLIFLSLVSLPLLASQTHKCIDLEKIYLQTSKEFHVNCQAHKECVTTYIAFDPCTVNSYNKESVLPIIESLNKVRNDLHQLCNFPKKNCNNPAMNSYCIDKKCRAILDFKQLENREITFDFEKSQGVVSISMDTGIRCVTTPCPSEKELLNFKTEKVPFKTTLKVFLEALKLNNLIFINFNGAQLTYFNSQDLLLKQHHLFKVP